MFWFNDLKLSTTISITKINNEGIRRSYNKTIECIILLEVFIALCILMAFCVVFPFLYISKNIDMWLPRLVVITQADHYQVDNELSCYVYINDFGK